MGLHVANNTKRYLDLYLTCHVLYGKYMCVFLSEDFTRLEDLTTRPIEKTPRPHLTFLTFFLDRMSSRKFVLD